MLSDAEPQPRRLAVGEFDGVHLGHREVIAGNDTVLTFDPHPLAVIRPEAAPKLLMSLDAKIARIKELGVRELVVIPFDETFASQSAQEFIDQVLVGRLQATHVSVGENFRFGHRARGDAALLEPMTASQTRVVQLVEVDGEIVSSSHIRATRAGRRRRARRPLSGLAVPAQGRGRDGRSPRPDARLSDRQHRPRREPRVPGPRRLRGARPTARCAAVSVGVRPTFGTGRARTRRGLPDRSGRRSLRPDAAPSTSSRGCAASAGSTPSRT